MNERIIATDETIRDILKKHIKRGHYDADLNHIDVSQVTDMSNLFAENLFNGDISQWDVSNVKDMSGMFKSSQFDGNIRNWDVSNVKDMTSMFEGSIFNRDISNWDTSSVKDMSAMFSNSKFNGNITQWNVSNVENMSGMFHMCKSFDERGALQWDVSNVKDMGSMFYISNFNGDISQWDVSNVCHMDYMFFMSKFSGDISKWDVSNVVEFGEALSKCPASKSEHFGALHFICKAEEPSLELHPEAQALWDEHAPIALAIGLEGPELGRAAWNSYQASIGQAQPMDTLSNDLVDMDFTMNTDWTTGCDPTQSTSQGHASEHYSTR